MHTLILSLWLILMIIVLFLAISVIRSQKRRISKAKKTGKLDSTGFTFRSAEKRLWKQLLTLLQSDSVTAERLLRHEQNKYPGKSTKWYLEKVIFNLKRDRH
ncbi:MAG: hypothetical protein ACKO99_21785 [Dolichospermum sp.]